MAIGQITLVDLHDGEDGQGLEDVEKEFYLSDSDTELIGGTWTTVQPDWEVNKYLWTREKLTWSNPTAVTETTPQVSNEWKAIYQVKRGERNLVLESNTAKTSTTTTPATYQLSSPIKTSTTYTAVYKGSHTNTAQDSYIGLYLNLDVYDQGSPIEVASNTYMITFTTPSSFMDNTNMDKVSLISTPKGLNTKASIDWLKIVEGETTSTDWSRAPEDVDQVVTDVTFKVDELNKSVESTVTEVGTYSQRMSRIEQDINGVTSTMTRTNRKLLAIASNTVSTEPGRYVFSVPNFDVSKSYQIDITPLSASATYVVYLSVRHPSSTATGYLMGAVQVPYSTMNNTTTISLYDAIMTMRPTYDEYSSKASDYIVNATIEIFDSTQADSMPVMDIYEELDTIQEVSRITQTLDKIESEVYDSDGGSRITQTSGKIESIVSEGLDIPVNYNNFPGVNTKVTSRTSGWNHQIDIPGVDISGGEKVTLTITNTASYNRTLNRVYIRWFSTHSGSWGRATDSRTPVTLKPGESYSFFRIIDSNYHITDLEGLVESPSSTGLELSLTGQLSTKSDLLTKATKISQTASEIAIEGLVSFTDLTNTSKTIIDGGVIQTGTISANKISTGILRASNNSYTYWNLNSGIFKSGTSSTNQITLEDGKFTSIGSTHETIIEQGQLTLQKKGTSDTSERLELTYDMPRILPYAPTSSSSSGFRAPNTTETGYSPPLVSSTSPSMSSQRFKLATYMVKVRVSSFSGTSWSNTFSANMRNHTTVDIGLLYYAHAVCVSHKELILHIRAFNVSSAAFKGVQLQATLPSPVTSWASADVTVAVLLIGTY